MTLRVALVTGVLLLGIGVFYAFNAYIQRRERGFAEPTYIPIALLSVAVGALTLWVALAARRTTR